MHTRHKECNDYYEFTYSQLSPVLFQDAKLATFFNTLAAIVENNDYIIGNNPYLCVLPINILT